MPLILSQERTVGIDVTMEKPQSSYGEWESGEHDYKLVKYRDHVKNAPRLPILGTVPDHWKEGEELPTGEYNIIHQALVSKSIINPKECWADIHEESETKRNRRKVIIPITTK